MVLDTKIASVRETLGLNKLEEWAAVTPQQILAIDGVGPVTLDTIRLYLAGRGVALSGDGTPQYWFQHLSRVRLGAEMADGENGVPSQFAVVIDGREREPYRFIGLTTKTAGGNEAPLLPNLEFGRLETGDYSVRGLEQLVAVERKSLADLYSTLGQDRDRFEREHERLAAMKTACVVIEAGWDEIIQRPPERSQLSPQSVLGTFTSWYQRYGVAWVALPNRRAAECFTYRFLEMFHRKERLETRKE